MHFQGLLLLFLLAAHRPPPLKSFVVDSNQVESLFTLAGLKDSLDFTPHCLTFHSSPFVACEQQALSAFDSQTPLRDQSQSKLCCAFLIYVECITTVASQQCEPTIDQLLNRTLAERKAAILPECARYERHIDCMGSPVKWLFVILLLLLLGTLSATSVCIFL